MEKGIKQPNVILNNFFKFKNKKLIELFSKESNFSKQIDFPLFAIGLSHIGFFKIGLRP